MPRAGLTSAAVVDAALALIDDEGPGALTLAAVAARTGVAAPSLYKHVRGLPELRKLVGLHVMDDMAVRLGTAAMGKSRDEAMAALMRAWRSYVVDFPHRYAAFPDNPLKDPDLVGTATRLLEVILAVLRGYGLEGAAALHTTRCVRAAVHGFASLEAAGGFGLDEDLNTSYEMLIAMVVSGLPRAPVS
ncbi:TetR-like C-terminal domain-containing protein [Streptosporangium sp. V21-05]|uniref:TetR-like C-terminal domain-containing protein n=1 Tax=Streptosporangium sp. V21-05 TaxID=3446115 RepID=UPI003F538D1D